MNIKKPTILDYTSAGHDHSNVAGGGQISISYGISGLGANVGTFLATPSSANLISAITDETGSGSLVFGTSPTFTTSIIVPLINGSIANSGTLTLRSTSSVTKATAGILMDENITSSSTGTGTLVITGGIGISGALYAGGLINGALGSTISGAIINLNVSSNFATNINTGTSTGAVHIADGSTGSNDITIGNKVGTTSIIKYVGTGNYVLDGVTNSTYTIGASTTTGTITIGGTAQTGNMIIGSSSGTNTLSIANGSGATTLNLANVQTAGSVNIGAAMTTGTITIGGTGLQTGTIGIGTGTGAQTINIGTGGTGVKTVHIADGAIGNIVTIGSTTGAASLTQKVGTGNYSLDGVTNSTYTIGTSTTTGTITIGGTAQTGTITLGSSSGTNILSLGVGAGATTVNIATGATNGKTVNIGTGSVANTIGIGNTTGATTVNLSVGTGKFNITGVTVNSGTLSASNLINGYTTTVTASQTTTLSVTSNNQQYFTGTTAGQIVKMPVTSTLVLGQSWIIINTSSQSITINSNASNLILTLPTLMSALITCINIASDAASAWSSLVYSNSTSVGMTNPMTTIGDIIYGGASGTPTRLTGNTTTTPQFFTSTGTGSASQAPTLTGSTGSNSVVLSNSPTFDGPTFITYNADPTSASSYGNSITITQTGASATNGVYSYKSSLVYNGTANTQSMRGASNFVRNQNTAVVTYMYGNYNSVFNDGAGAVTNLVGVVGAATNTTTGSFNKILGGQFVTTNNTTNGVNYDMYGITSQVVNTGSITGGALGLGIYTDNTGGTLPYSIGVQIQCEGMTNTSDVRGISIGTTAHAWTGTPTNLYGLYIHSSVTGGITDNYSIYNNSPASSYFSARSIFNTDIISPIVIGGTSTTSSLTYKTTTGVGTTGADHIFKVGNNGATEAMRILNSGYVGIGTSTPSGKTHIYDTNSANQAYALRTEGTNTGTNWSGRIVAGGPTCVFLMGQYNNQAWLGSHNAALSAWNDFYINPDGTAKLFVGSYNGALATFDNNTFRVGIGTQAPTSLLTVNGDTNFGLTTGGTYNGNVLISKSDQYPLVAFRSGTTVKSQIFSNVNTGDIFWDIPASLSVRSALGGGSTFLSYSGSTGQVTLQGSIASTSISTGTLVINGGGGLGVAGNAFANNFNNAYNTTATANGTTTLTVASTRIQFFTGTLYQAIQMPAVSGLALGFEFEINNNSTASISLYSSGNNYITNVAPNSYCIITCISTSGTSQTSWSTKIVLIETIVENFNRGVCNNVNIFAGGGGSDANWTCYGAYFTPKQTMQFSVSSTLNAILCSNTTGYYILAVYKYAATNMTLMFATASTALGGAIANLSATTSNISNGVLVPGTTYYFVMMTNANPGMAGVSLGGTLALKPYRNFSQMLGNLGTGAAGVAPATIAEPTTENNNGTIFMQAII